MAKPCLKLPTMSSHLQHFFPFAILTRKLFLDRKWISRGKNNYDLLAVIETELTADVFCETRTASMTRLSVCIE